MDTKKIGIMGGTFDPIHYGHLILAQTALETFALDQVWFMPSKTPPHKADGEVTSASHRLEMTRLAVKNNSGFSISSMEMEREGYIYTFETLEILKKEYPNVKFYFIMGADSLYNFDKWREPAKICSLCTILAANRSQDVDAALQSQLESIQNKYHADIHLLKIPAIEISSSRIREKKRIGESIRYYTPEAVVDYIEQHQLYLP